MPNQIADISVEQLRRAIDLKQQIEKLEAELSGMLRVEGIRTGPTGPRRGGRLGKGRRRMSAEARARIAAAQRARWARRRGMTNTTMAKRKRRTMSAAARARIAAAQRARWARVRAGK